MKKSLYFKIILALLLVVVLNGCGSGSKPKTLSINSTAELDGWVSGNYDPNTLYPIGEPVGESVLFINSLTIQFGARFYDVAPNKVIVSRCLLSFDISSLAGKTITNAVLKVHISSVPEDDPFDAEYGLGDLLVDHFTTNYTNTDMANLFGGWSSAVSGAMSADQGWRVINVTNEVVADQTAGPEHKSQFRLHFEYEMEVSESTKEIIIETSSNANNKPVLIVTYQ